MSTIASLESQIAKLKAPQVTARMLLDALRLRHSDAVFIDEVKNGPTHTASHRRLDAWVLLKTWSPITCIGFEIKVARSDWLRDDKIGEYLGLCHLFYIVAPKGLIPVSELPTGVGLLEMVGDNQRLVTRHKAARREITMPVDLLVYVLMCRAHITRDRESPGYSHRTDALRKWTEDQQDRRQLSWAVSRKIREAFDAQEQRQAKLAHRLSGLESIEKRIVELGFDPQLPVGSWNIEDRLQQMSGEASRLAAQVEEMEQRLAAFRLRLTEKL